jgi:hypothetical protein
MDGGEFEKPWRINGMGSRGSAFSFPLYIDRPMPPVEVIGDSPSVDVIADPSPFDVEVPAVEPERQADGNEEPGDPTGFVITGPAGELAGEPIGNEQLEEPASDPQPSIDGEPDAAPIGGEAVAATADTGLALQSPPIEVVQITTHEIVGGSRSHYHDASEAHPHRHGNRAYFAPHVEAGVDAVYTQVGGLSEINGELEVYFRQGIAARLEVPESAEPLRATHPGAARRGLRLLAVSRHEEAAEVSQPVLRATRRRR